MKPEIIPAYPLQWPTGWKRAAWRERSNFGDHSFARVRDDLMRELKLLGAKDTTIVLSTNIPLRRDGLPLSGQSNPKDPGVAVYFERNGKRVVFACDEYHTVNENAWAICKTIEALRGIKRWGASDMLERSFTGFAALPAPQAIAWPTILRVPATASLGDIKKAYYELAKIYHPDTGSTDSAKWMQISQAYELAVKERSNGNSR